MRFSTTIAPSTLPAEVGAGGGSDIDAPCIVRIEGPVLGPSPTIMPCTGIAETLENTCVPCGPIITGGWN